MAQVLNLEQGPENGAYLFRGQQAPPNRAKTAALRWGRADKVPWRALNSPLMTLLFGPTRRGCGRSIQGLSADRRPP